MNATVDLDSLNSMPLFSYYFENVFQIEDFYLYRAIFKFYAKNYTSAINDFEICSSFKQRESK